MHTNKLILFSLLLGLLFSCSPSQNAFFTDPQDAKANHALPSSNLKHKLYLIGDAGGLDDDEKKVNHVIQAAKAKIKNDTVKTSVFLLGDNIYNSGLSKSKGVNRKYEEDIIDAQLDLADDTKANLYFIPGNHDWNNNQKGGLPAIKRQAKYIKNNKISKKRVHFYPKEGCGDPHVVKIDNDLVYVIIDSQWWVHNWDSESKINKGCKINSRREFLDKMQDIIIDHKNDQIMIFLHHPMISNGNHGGNFGAKDHLFPLSKLNENILIPTPFIGSIIPLFRQLGGSNQDITSQRLAKLKSSLEKVIRGYDVGQAVFISGHDHLLQHSEEQFIFQKHPIHYIISGSGYKTGYAARGNNVNYVQSTRGYSILNFYEDGSTWLDFYSVNIETKEETLTYRTQVYQPAPGKQQHTNFPVDETKNKSILAPPNENFGKGKVYEFMMGKQYRPAWTTPIETEIFRLDRYHGGLRPLKKGGGLFSRTLRLENHEYKQFVMRSINKDFFKAVPKNLQHLEIMKLYADQNTAAIPYGALYISALSEHVDVYHTEPQIVYLENTEELEKFESFFPKGHYLLEARPNGDWSDSELFGGSDQIFGYNDLLHNIRKKTMHFVDQKWVLKSRIFDILIHDRDRHDDQWRWAAFEEGDHVIYRPIPRDRDWAFFKYEGVIPWVLGNVVDSKLKSFKPSAIDVKSLSTNANTFDRYFLNELSWTQWEGVIDQFLEKLTDEAIESSVLALPSESRAYLENEIVPKLKSRKKVLKSELKKYYDFITQEVEITGSDEKDNFKIDLLKNGDVHVVVYKDSDKYGKVKHYDRILKLEETKDIRIYGLAGKDKFNITINGSKHPHIRIIGGIDDDKLKINSINNSKGDIEVYDDIKGMEINAPSMIVDKRKDDDLQTNEYDRRAFLYDTGLPWLKFGFAPDEGVSFGFGFNSIKHGWRKHPFRVSHLLNTEITPGERFSLKVQYEGEYPNSFGNGWGFAPSFSFRSPKNINFFGLGQNSTNTRESSYNWVQLSSFSLNTHLIKRTVSNHIRVRLGPTIESHQIDDEDEPNILNDVPNLINDIYKRRYFLGVQSDVRLHTLDRINKPSKGVMIRGLIKHQYETNDKNHTLKLGTNFSWFYPISYHRDITFGSNTGFETILGDPIFYQYPAMGNKAFLRPFRNERYRGETILYQQFDLRFRLFNWNNSILPLAVGGIAGYDVGQVYFKDQDTGPWKHGWTTGLSFDIVGFFLLRTSFSGSEEGNYFKFDVGYAF